MKNKSIKFKLAVIGAGYVGLDLSLAFSKKIDFNLLKIIILN